ncbi:hypothetical protein PEBR_20793 [Penicillium brasilianum]|uniref:Uncharacterized protein n=1 Tax=Penicillium brasilianum TaxID=104259 RepID=A0A1S9RMP0_PENBI|nr:hypothetical protein PEBR_20793 [Penicillium brasilianum]
MSPPSSWFTEGYMRQAIQVGKVISLSHPQPSKWRILMVLREHDDQKYETAKDPSYASLELSCIEVEGHHRRSMMRIIMQVPPVPGGFITYYAWQAVPGIRLGDYTGKAPQFWTLDKEEREKIRIAFRQIYSEITFIGIWPDSAAAANLVWNSETETLTWVGFWNCRAAQPYPWGDWRLPSFDFVKSPDGSWTDPDWNGDTSKWQY